MVRTWIGIEPAFTNEVGLPYGTCHVFHQLKEPFFSFDAAKIQHTLRNLFA